MLGSINKKALRNWGIAKGRRAIESAGRGGTLDGEHPTNAVESPSRIRVLVTEGAISSDCWVSKRLRYPASNFSVMQ